MKSTISSRRLDVECGRCCRGSSMNGSERHPDIVCWAKLAPARGACAGNALKAQTGLLRDLGSRRLPEARKARDGSEQRPLMRCTGQRLQDCSGASMYRHQLKPPPAAHLGCMSLSRLVGPHLERSLVLNKAVLKPWVHQLAARVVPALPQTWMMILPTHDGP